MANMINTYLAFCRAQLERVEKGSGHSIDEAAHEVAQAIMEGQNYYLFGSGHSALIAREAFWRAGGFAPAMPIPDPLGGDVERLSGVASAYLMHYDLQPGDVILVVSNSGMNHLPIEVAMECKAREMKVIALTSLAHSQSVESRHHSGKKLYEIADLVIDTFGSPGDAALDLAGSEFKVGPTSTVVGAAIIQAITARAAEIMVAQGYTPPLVVSVNTAAGDAHNREITKVYRQRLVRYEVPTVDQPQPRN
jgi:uncharacterized phosphosugar-binding protein